jgi:hypothetical protein
VLPFTTNAPTIAQKNRALSRSPEIAAAVARDEPFVLEAAGQSIELGPDEVLVETESAEGYACAEQGG